MCVCVCLVSMTVFVQRHADLAECLADCAINTCNLVRCCRRPGPVSVWVNASLETEQTRLAAVMVFVYWHGPPSDATCFSDLKRVRCSLQVVQGFSYLVKLWYAILITILHSYRVDPKSNVYNSPITYATNTKLVKSTAVNDLVIISKACSCKPSVTKLASAIHTLLQLPQLCSLLRV